MAEIQSLTNYKKALVLSKDLQAVLLTIDNTLHELKPHTRYIPVKNILSSLMDNRKLVVLFLNKYNKIVQTKGRMSDEH